MSALFVFILASVCCFLMIGFCTAFARKRLWDLAKRLREEGADSPRLFSVKAYAGVGIVALAALLGGLFLFGSPIPGCLCLGGFWVLTPAIRRVLEGRWLARFESSSLPFFYALAALLQVGLALPEALFRAARQSQTPFSRRLLRHLNNFPSGTSLEECLNAFKKRYRLETSSLYFQVLQTAYVRGLPVSQFMDSMLPLLEAEEARRERLKTLRQGAWAQVGLVVSLSWGLAAFLALWQPDFGPLFWGSRWAIPCLVTAAAFQLGGIWALQRALRW